jgi:hypothetical protein
MKKLAVPLLVVVFLAITGGFVVFVNMNGSSEPKVTVDAQKITIEADHGITIDTAGIKGVYLADTAPENLRKTNGFELGGVLKGEFGSNTEPLVLFINRGHPPFIYIERQNEPTVIINFEDQAKTQNLYEEIRAEAK